MDQKSILCCGRCRYFPIRQEWQRYFLNSNTYKCPACHQLTMFDNSHQTLLDKQIQFYAQCQQHVAVESTDQSGRTVMKLNALESNDENQSVTVIILIQDSEEYLEGFYMNPINSRLRNECNINKEQALRQQSHIIFSHNYEFTIQNMSHFTTTTTTTNSINIINKDSSSRFKQGLRRVNKIDHLLYCIDDYIQLTSEMPVNNNHLDERQNNATIITGNSVKYQIWKVVKDDQYKLTKLAEFSHSAYTHMTDQSKHISQSPLINTTFYSKLYCAHQHHHTHNQHTQMESYQLSLAAVIDNAIMESRLVHLKAIALFAHQPNLHLVGEIERVISQSSVLNTNELVRTHLPLLHHFYLIDSINNQPPSKSTSNPNVTIEVYRDCLYQPLTSSSKRTPHDLISNVLTKSFAQSTNHDDDIVGKLNTNSQGQHNWVLLFWTQTSENVENNTDNQHNIINFIKINTQSLQIFTLLNQINQQIKTTFQEMTSNQKKNNQIKGITSKLNNYTLKILQQTLSRKIHHQIILDRLICYCDGKKAFYVFDFDEKMKENFEQIDFLDEVTLPKELRDYALTYENIEIKEQNPFRKSNNKVFVVADSSINENNFHDVYNDDSDQRESL